MKWRAQSHRDTELETTVRRVTTVALYKLAVLPVSVR